ncbi:hypothetical protein RV14_GL002181 [Enterococcus ratti]|uniref:Uncharacterized protein n=1 Tax=Enterococcus ratti TaxID=150033 RepID=A0A1L8WPD7_9ENTE|nr:hypothetical protein RV14_GL002181 [Enterococcus ratti]
MRTDSSFLYLHLKHAFYYFTKIIPVDSLVVSCLKAHLISFLLYFSLK